MSARAALVAAMLALGLPGCGGSSEDPDPAPDPDPQRETVDQLPKLPASWAPYVSRQAGFAIGRPAGWRPRPDGAATVVRSPDHLVAISITAARGASALMTGPPTFARRTARSLPGFKRPLRIGRPHPFAAAYPAALVRARGTGGQRVPERITVVAMRRAPFATYAAVVAVNAERASPADERRALRVVRSLRGRPAAAPG